MMYQSNQHIPEAARLEDYLQAIRLRKWLVLALALLGLLGAFLFATSRQPTYTAETTVLLRGSPSESRIPGQDAARRAGQQFPCIDPGSRVGKPGLRAPI